MTASRCLLLLLAEAFFIHVHAHRICNGKTRTAPGRGPAPDGEQRDDEPAAGPNVRLHRRRLSGAGKKYYTANLMKGQTSMISDKILFEAGKTEINGLGFNTLDGFLYGVRGKMLVRMMADGSSQNVSKFPFKHANTGAFDMDGQHWFSEAGGRWGQIDLTPRSATYGELKSSGESERTGLNRVGDWAYTPKYPGSFWTVNVDMKHNPALFNWSTETHEWQKWYEMPRDEKKDKKPYSFGAVVSTSDGVIYGIENRSGAIYRFPLDNLNKSAEVGNLPIASRNDGARCMNESDWKQ